MAPDAGHRCQSNAGVPRGRLNDGLATVWNDTTLAFGVVNNPERDAILDTSDRVHKYALNQQVALDIVQPSVIFHPNYRCMADQI